MNLDYYVWTIICILLLNFTVESSFFHFPSLWDFLGSGYMLPWCLLFTMKQEPLSPRNIIAFIHVSSKICRHKSYKKSLCWGNSLLCSVARMKEQQYPLRAMKSMRIIACCSFPSWPTLRQPLLFIHAISRSAVLNTSGKRMYLLLCVW